MRKTPGTPEFLERNYKLMGENITTNFPFLCDAIKTLEEIDKTDIDSLDDNQANIIIFWRELLRIYASSLFINLDLSTLLRASHRSQSNSEKRANMKYINFIIVEGYRYLFARYGEENPTADPVWVQFMKIADKLNIKELLEDFSEVEDYARIFADKYVTGIDANGRNFAIHYDINVVKLYNYLVNLDDEDVEYKRVYSYLKLNEIIFKHTLKWIEKLNIPLLNIKSDFTIPVSDIISCQLKSENKVYDAPNLVLMQSTTAIDSIMKQIGATKELIKEHNLVSSNNEFSEAIESVFPTIHTLFMKIDLASAVRAYFKSESFIEGVLNLRRINIIVYEGLHKIYGFDESKRDRTFWSKYIVNHISSNCDQAVVELIRNTEINIKKLMLDSIINDINLRNHSCHYRYNDNDYLIPAFHDVIALNPMVECAKIKLMLSAITKLEKCNEVSLNILKKSRNEIYKQNKIIFMDNFDKKNEVLLSNPMCNEETKNALSNLRKLLEDKYL